MYKWEDDNVENLTFEKHNLYLSLTKFFMFIFTYTDEGEPFRWDG